MQEVVADANVTEAPVFQSGGICGRELNTMGKGIGLDPNKPIVASREVRSSRYS